DVVQCDGCVSGSASRQAERAHSVSRSITAVLIDGVRDPRAQPLEMCFALKSTVEIGIMSHNLTTRHTDTVSK
ncbi:MAG TPA: hypothetical protein VFE27_13610, partial [Acidobacteriaceae bacterium]|nr:hypothetical protein [Acidobacteriaceae bacterium]